MTAELKQYIDDAFRRLEATTLIGVKTMLSAEEAATYTDYALKSIYDLTHKKKIPHYKKNGKLYFKKTELDEWMAEDRVLTERELNIRATTYVATH